MLRTMLFALFLAIFAGSVQAQTAPASPPVSGQVAPRPDLDQMRGELTLIEAQLQRDGLADSELDRLRARLTPIMEAVQAIIDRETPKLEEINARLDRLGPTPKDTEPRESAEISKSRSEQEAQKKDIDDVIRVTRLLQVRAGQASGGIIDYRRRLFTREILERSQSIVSPWLWADAFRTVPAAASDFSALVQFRMRQAFAGLDTFKVSSAAALFFLLLFAYRPSRRMLLDALDSWADDRDGLPTRGERALAALRGMLLRTLLPLAMAVVLSLSIGLIGLGADRLGEFLQALFYSFAILAFVRGVLVGVLQPERPEWRVAKIEQRSAEILYPVLWAVILTVFFGKIAEAATQSISGALPITVIVKGLTSVLAAATLLFGLLRLDAYQEQKEEALDAYGPAVGSGAGNAVAVLLKMLCWCAVIAVTGAAVTGYIALASFLTDQLVWLMTVGSFLAILLIIVQEYLGKGTVNDNYFMRRVRAITGIRPSSIKQISILASGISQVLIYGVGFIMFLAPLGLNSGDLFGASSAVLFGFQIGGVTVSISKIVTTIVLFLGLFFLFRGVRRWIETKLLPSTSLDSGLQNSIATVVGYIGFAIAAVVAMGYFGLSLDKIAIVAGALSVGIGFGLQSIVNNFVSGLILLWERPIKVGDLISVGPETGRVRRINVRSTEIETADRASLIVPNSEFISGKVKNLMHSNRMARVVIPMAVASDSDPHVVRKALLDAANGHIEVLTSPAPDVVFLDVSSTALSFELRCFADIDAQVTVRSDLMFDIYARLKSLAAIVPPPKAPITVQDVKALAAALTDPAH